MTKSTCSPATTWATETITPGTAGGQSEEARTRWAAGPAWTGCSPARPSTAATAARIPTTSAIARQSFQRADATSPRHRRRDRRACGRAPDHPGRGDRRAPQRGPAPPAGTLQDAGSRPSAALSALVASPGSRLQRRSSRARGQAAAPHLGGQPRPPGSRPSANDLPEGLPDQEAATAPEPDRQDEQAVLLVSAEPRGLPGKGGPG